MTQPLIDLLDDSPDGKPVPDSPSLQSVSKLAIEYGLLEADIKTLKEQIAVREARMNTIVKEAMPMAMEQAGVSSFTASNGRSIKIEEIVNGNIPAESTINKERDPARKAALIARRVEALGVVRSKWPGLIKTELSVSLAKGETEQALRIAELIRKQFQLTSTIDETIHPASLNSHFKELKDNGRLGEIPIEPFALYIGPIAKIK
jgi:hypothetical protein